VKLAAGIRFPRSMLANPASERLLVMLGVEIVEHTTPDLEKAAREWLAGCDGINPNLSPATRHVAAALERIDERRVA
jgi:hypothetical protein